MILQKEKAVSRFQEILRVETISRKDDSTNWAEFDRFLPTLKEQFPQVFEKLECTVINKYGIVLRWKGKNPDLQPVILMAHHDVVPVEGQDWSHPPFAAEIHEDKIYARGTVDTKCILGAVLEAMDSLLNFSSSRSMVMIFLLVWLVMYARSMVTHLDFRAFSLLTKTNHSRASISRLIRSSISLSSLRHFK